MLITPVSGGSQRSINCVYAPPFNPLADASGVTEASASDPWSMANISKDCVLVSCQWS